MEKMKTLLRAFRVVLVPTAFYVYSIGVKLSLNISLIKKKYPYAFEKVVNEETEVDFNLDIVC